MAVIDEKGRIFGKLNIIDILALLLIIAAAVVLIGKVMENRGSGELPSMNMRYTVLVRNVEPAVYESLQAVTLPDQLMASGEMLSGQVTRIESVPAAGEVFQFRPNDEGAMTLERGINEALDLTFTIEVFVADRTINEIGTQEIRIGKEHIVKTCNFEFERGIILDCQWLQAAA